MDRQTDTGPQLELALAQRRAGKKETRTEISKENGLGQHQLRTGLEPATVQKLQEMQAIKRDGPGFGDHSVYIYTYDNYML